MVYFIRCGNFIKIGHTVGHPRARLAALQTANPIRLTIAGLLPGDARTERSFHKRFEKYRVIGEWFADDGELNEFITVSGGLVSVADYYRFKKRLSAPAVIAKRRAGRNIYAVPVLSSAGDP